MSLKQVPTAAELTRLTPPQVDDIFADVYEEEHRLETNRLRAVESILLEAGARRDYQSRAWDMTFSEALATVENLGARGKDVLRHLAQVDREIAALIEGPQAVLDHEFARRGGWTRAFLVTDGHVHRHQNCSSCHKGAERTRFSWMTQYSGKSEEEIVDAAGEKACTICYPSAPVARGEKAPKSVMFTPEEIQREQDREAAAKAKQERAAKKAAKAITDADGSPLTVYTWTQKAHQKRMRDGRLVDMPEREFSDTLATLHAARGWLTDQFEGWRGNVGDHRDLPKVARAVAAKEDKTTETVLAEARTRAEKRKR
jgi:mono/diheme cytochrome c family protein